MTKIDCIPLASRLLLSVALLPLAAAALAQTAPPAAPQTAQAEPPPGRPQGRLEEVVVTAEKHSESIQKVPMSIQALTADDLDHQGIKDIGDVARLVPGLNLQSSNWLGDSLISLRGIIAFTGAATTGIYIDDTPVQVRETDFTASNPYPKVFDLDRIEVLKGPQGTLFGAGSEGGTIRFLTPQPSLTEYTGLIKAGVEATDGGDPSWEIGGAVGGPIVEGKLGFRVSAWERTDGGYVDRVDRTTGAVLDANSNWAQTVVYRGALTWAPTDALKITPSVYYQDSYHNDQSLYWESAGLFRNAAFFQQPRDDHFILPELKAEYDFGDFTLTAIGSYFHRTNNVNSDDSAFEMTGYTGYLTGTPFADAISLPNFPNYRAPAWYRDSQDNFSGELRFNSNNGPDSRWNWVGGLFIQHTRQITEQAISEPQLPAVISYIGSTFFGGPTNFNQAMAFWFDSWTPGTPLPSNPLAYQLWQPGDLSYLDHELVHENDIAFFGNVGYRITDEIKLQVGLRVARSGFDFVDNQGGPWNQGPQTGQGSEKEMPVTPRVSLSYDIADDQMIYTTVAEGYRIGGANESIAFPSCAGDLASLGIKDAPPTYQSDTDWSYELGTKAKFFDNHLLLDGAIFWIDWKNIQNLVYLPTCGYSYTANLGQAASRGFEAQFQYSVGNGLVFSGNTGLTDARYTQTFALQPIGGPPVILAKKGDSLATPEWTATASAEYDFEPVEGYDASIRLDYDFSGPYYRMGSAETFSYDADVRNAPASHQVSARLEVTHDKMDVTLFVNNLLNSTTSLYRYHDIAGAPGYRDATFRPLTVGLSAQYKF